MVKNIYWQGFLGALLSTAIFTVSCSEAGSETKVSQTPSIAQSQNSQWQPMSEEQKQGTIDLIINRPLGIAALNQLAVEGFVGADCNRNFYTDKETGFRILMQVKCSSPRGISIALAYDEMRITFSRFEDNIENFSVERVSAENRDRVTPLPPD
jgi:hypothetical protein